MEEKDKQAWQQEKYELIILIKTVSWLDSIDGS
jgi:hypothetical protein